MELFYNKLSQKIAEQYRNDPSCIIDALGDTLAQSFLSFPIIEAGEQIHTLCPFTVLAAFHRNDSMELRVYSLNLFGKYLGIVEKAPDTLWCLPTVKNYQARFFGSGANVGANIELLTHLFLTAVDFAQNPNDQKIENEFSEAFNQVMSSRIKEKELIPLALSWINPHFYPYIPKESNDSLLEAHPNIFENNANLTAEKYLSFFHDCHQKYDEDLNNLLQINAKIHRRLQAITFDNTAVDDVRTRLKALSLEPHEQTKKLAFGIQTFISNWNLKTDGSNFQDMALESISELKDFLQTGYNFRAFDEMCLYIQKYPNDIKNAFDDLYNSDLPYITRILKFEEKIAILFDLERHNFGRATVRQSSHSNYYALSLYTYIEDPENYVFFEPNLAMDFSRVSGLKNILVFSKPEIIDQYNSAVNEFMNQLDCPQLIDKLTENISEQYSLSEKACRKLAYADIIFKITDK